MALIVKVLSAELTRDTEIFGNMDPYVKVTLGSACLKSQVHQDGGKHPIWNSQLMFRQIPKNPKLRIDVFDEGITSDDFIGGGFFSLEKILQKPNKPSKQKINIQYQSKLSGVVTIEVEYSDPTLKEKDQLTIAVQNSKPARSSRRAPILAGAGSKEANTEIDTPIQNRKPLSSQGTPTLQAGQQAVSGYPQQAYYPQNYPAQNQFAPYYSPGPQNPYHQRNSLNYLQPQMYPQQTLFPQPATYPQRNPISGPPGNQPQNIFSMVGSMFFEKGGNMPLPEQNKSKVSEKDQRKRSIPNNGWDWNL